MNRLAPVLYLPHGGGPLPLLGDPAHHGLVSFLQGLAERIPRRDAILLGERALESRGFGWM